MLTSLSSGFSCARMPSPVSSASASPASVTTTTFASNASAWRTAASATAWAFGSTTATLYSSWPPKPSAVGRIATAAITTSVMSVPITKLFSNARSVTSRRATSPMAWRPVMPSPPRGRGR